MTIIALIVRLVKYRGTSSNDLNSFEDASDSDATLTWTNVVEESDVFFGFLISIFITIVHIPYAVDVTVGLTWPQ
jgi:hypothetical protein